MGHASRVIAGLGVLVVAGLLIVWLAAGRQRATAPAPLPKPHKVSVAAACARPLTAVGSPVDDDHFYGLSEAAQKAYERGDLDGAERLAIEALTLALSYPDNWNYGNAIHQGHRVLGLVALKRGDRDKAALELIQSGCTPGSPQLDSFGPTMDLARLVLGQGDRAAVLAYLEELEAFWPDAQRCRGTWRKAIADGEVPNFRAFDCS